MNNIISEMLKKYDVKNINDEKNAIKQIIQEIVLCGLSRGGFFNEAAFYGGTTLRIFYGLDRFSEDLDFALLEENKDFDINKYFPFIKKEALAYGLKIDIKEKEKNFDSNISSAFLKTDTKTNILTFFPNDEDILNNNMLGNIKIKLEIDINPAKYATYETKIKFLPSIHTIKLYDFESLFAGKIHAILCRNWKTRIKGRDLYDYIFYLAHNIKVNFPNLKEKLINSNYIDSTFNLNEESLKKLLIYKFNEIDFNKAKEDVLPFISNSETLNLWDKEFFIKITKDANFK